MRLIQQKPSWALHAFLRFNDLRYASEYTPSFSALGRNLPIIVTGKAVVSEEESMTYLSEQLCNDGTDHKLSLDGILAKFFKSSIVACFNQIVRYNGDYRDVVFKSSPVGLNVVFAGVLDIQDALNKDKFDFLPGASEDELLNHLKLQYKQLDAALLGRENEAVSSLISITKNSFMEAQRVSSTEAVTKRGQADAVLFGHIAEVLCNENLSPILLKYPALMRFFENVCSTFFAVPFNAKDSDGNNWNVALTDLLSNPYLGQPHCDRVKSLLTTPKKGGLELTFKATAPEDPSTAAKSVLYLNDYKSIDEREITVHDHASQATTVVLNREGLFPAVKAVVDKSSQVLDNLKTSVGLNKEGTGRVGDASKGFQTNSTVVSVSVGGLLYMGLVAACFVGYAAAAKK